MKSRFKIQEAFEHFSQTLKSLVCRHPEPRLQATWNVMQLGLLLYPWMPTVGIVGLLLAVAGSWKQEYRAIVRRPLNWGLAILSGWLVITCFFASKRAEAFLGLANFLPYFLLFAAYSRLIQYPSQLRQLAKIFVIGSLPVVFIGFGQLFWGWAGKEPLQIVFGWILEAKGNPPGRMASVFMYANILAAYLQMAFILAVGLWIEVFQAGRKRWNKFQVGQLLFLSVAVIGNAIALILTNSRNAWAIAVLACLAFGLYLGWRWIVLAVTTAAGTILWASFGPEFGRQWLRSTIVPAFFWARLTDQLYPNRPLALMRKTQWQFAWNMTQERPWMGWGLRNFTPLYEAKMHLWLGHPHNLLLMLMAETGIPATLLFCGLIGWVLTQAVLLLRIWSDIESLEDRASWLQGKLIFFTYLVAFGGCTLFNLVDVTLFDLRVNTLGWLLLSAICGVVYQYQGILTSQRLKKAIHRD
ncbi:O-antigen ligase family protein [Allocoleopsis sp.]|uniref:O-antigen ligase family protein n=1 Tax=Allocoleopsis sp. TaxID=3088169 RepID=UPI002FD46FFB